MNNQNASRITINPEETNKKFLLNKKNSSYKYMILGKKDIVNKCKDTKENIKKIKDYSLKLFDNEKYKELNSYLNIKIKEIPNSVLILKFLAISQYHSGLRSEATENFKKIIRINSKDEDALNGLAVILNDENRYDDALLLLNNLKKHRIKNSNTFNNIGLSYFGKNEFKLAEINFFKAISIDNNSNAKKNLSNIYKSYSNKCLKIKDYTSAVKYLLKAKQFCKNDIGILSDLLGCYADMGRNNDGIITYEEGLKLKTHSFEFFYNAARFFGFNQLDGDKAVFCSKKALQYSPENFDALNNLSIYYSTILKNDKLSIKILKKLISLFPENDRPLNSLGNIFNKNGFQENAILAYNKALSLNPDNIHTYSNFLYSLTKIPGISDKELFNEFLKFGKKFNNPQQAFKNYNVKKTSNRKIRLGFISADFREHAIQGALLPIFQQLDKNKFEFFCYSNNNFEDQITLEYKEKSKSWLNCYSIEDFQLAKTIWKDQIDILFDMSGHTGGNRLKVFTYKPAPIQITWMGFPATTGLDAMDFTIWDKNFAPKTVDNFFVEKILRLPSTVPLVPPVDLKLTKPLKNRRQKEVFFASFNNSRKLNDEVLSCWAKILITVEGSKIIVGNLEELAFDWVGSKLVELGVKKDNIILFKKLKLDTYLETHKKVDVILDSWPYTGGTTTAYASMYGIPVVTLTGNTVIHNQSSGILKNIGILDGIVSTKEEYVLKAIELASDFRKLYKLKLQNHKKYKEYIETKQGDGYSKLEKLLQKLWLQYCLKNSNL